MAVLVIGVLLLAMTGCSSGIWCTCKGGVSETILQRTLDYACGAGADCNPIHPKGVCYNPNTLKAHCNYAVNSYFQSKGQAQGTCDFAGSATITGSDPSTPGCVYPASPSTAASTSAGTTTPSTSAPTTTITGILGGISNSINPSGPGNTNADESDGGLSLLDSGFFPCILILMLSGLMTMFCWG